MTDPAPSPTVGPSGSDDPPADAVVVGLGPDGPLGLPPEAPAAALARLVDSGEARHAVGTVAHTHGEDGVRWILVGLGSDPTDEDRRAAVGAAVRHARTLRARTVRVVLDAAAGAGPAAEGATLALHEPAKVVGRPAADPDPDAATQEDPEVRIARPAGAVADEDVVAAVSRGAAIAGAQNGARVLQQLPSNHLTPRLLATRARALADELPGLEATVEVGIGALRRRGMGLFAAVSHGSDQPPALITLRWEPEGASGPLLGLVGKAVTHDTGGYSLKPPLSMRTMRFDMSGGAAVLGAMEAIARLRLPVRVLAVVCATENLVNGSAMKPDDVFTAKNGTTVEITNTDAEGRLVLADGLTYALELGAERLVDIATLTGGVVTALGTSHAGLMGRDDAWLGDVTGAGEATGERVWRLPLEDAHRELLKSRLADLTNSGGRVAHPIQGAAFLERFTGEVPWAHVDMAALSHDLPRKYLAKGPSGWGVRLLTATAARLGG
ncbi:M17 family metallopeptidase [Patulibacter sp.]|uniref:leucyl aminopeptidase family protein n=1 Tax=Patulibacter sp. TaxID=1912859 RepID=UPI00271C0789|nr:leucyl aminopeptidase [Patulibacter sp.]MDO9410802.1 leucyl aminopeptidase [Patulibacter sp.]